VVFQGGYASKSISSKEYQLKVNGPEGEGVDAEFIHVWKGESFHLSHFKRPVLLAALKMVSEDDWWDGKL